MPMLLSLGVLVFDQQLKNRGMAQFRVIYDPKKASIRENNPSQSLALENVYETIKIMMVGW